MPHLGSRHRPGENMVDPWFHTIYIVLPSNITIIS